MSITQPNGVCPAYLIGLKDLLSEDPTMFNTPVGAIQSTLDPENTRGVKMQQLASEGGHSKSVRISHKQRLTPTDVADAKSCDEGSEKPYFEEVFTVNQHSQIALKVKESTIRTLCAAQSNWVDPNGTNKASSMQVMREMAEELMHDLDAIRQDINQKFLTSIALNFGTWVGGATSKSFTVMNASDGALNLAGFNQMRQELSKVNAGKSPIAFGGGALDLALMGSALYGCCNDKGQDFGVMRTNGAGFKFYADYENLASYLGNANAFGAFLPGAVQFVTYNKYVGDFAKEIGTMSRGTLLDPALPGKMYDMRLMPSECDEDYDLWINSDFDFYFAPNNLFKSADRLASVNGIFKGIAATT